LCVTGVQTCALPISALTSIFLATKASMMSNNLKEFYINKPYVLIIQDINKSILFIGKIDNPIK
jgi:serine protease inhibitor